MCFCLAVTAGIATAAERFHTGRRFEKQLESPASVYWSDVLLRDGFYNLARTRLLGVWVDRRCDPGLQISFKTASPRLKDCIWKLNDEIPAVEVCWVDDLLYVGPRSASVRFATVHEIHKRQLVNLPTEIRRRWRSKRKVEWPRLSDPVELLKGLEQELTLKIQGKEKVLHDLWPASVLPPLPLYQRLELLLAGFDLTFVLERDGGAKIVGMPQSPKYSRKVELPEQHEGEVRQLLAKYGGTLADGSLIGNWRVHQIVDRVLNPLPASQDVSRIRYTLRAENQQLGDFIRSLCEQLRLECKFVDVPAESAQQRVSFQVEKATLRELFEKVLERSGLEVKLSDTQVVVTKKSKAE